MSEFRRILGKRNSLFVFLVLLVFYSIFFVFSCSEVKQITLVGEELERYINGYQERIQQVCDNASEMLENPLFRANSSFGHRNVIQTGLDYETLKNVRPVFGENRSILMVLEFSLTDILLLLIGIYIVLNFFTERQKGLYLLVRSTYHGRMRLTLWRLGVLVSGILMTAVILFSTTLFLGNLFYPGVDLSRPIQSLPEFGEVISHQTIGGYLAIFVLKRCLGCLVLCLLLWLCMSIFQSSFSILCFALLLFGEFLCYYLIHPTERISVFLYCNLYTYLFYGVDYAKYYNLNLMGYPVATGRLAFVCMVLLAIVLSIVCLYRFTKQYPKKDGAVGKFRDAAERIWSKKKPQLSLLGWEMKKVFLSQRGILVLAAMLYLTISSARQTQYLDSGSKYIGHWYEQFAGEVTAEKITEIKEELKKQKEYKANAEEQLIWWQQSVERKSLSHQKRIQEKIANNQPITEKDRLDVSQEQKKIEELTERIEELTKEIQGLSIVLERAEEYLEFSKVSHLRLQLMDASTYELLLFKDKQTILRNYLTSLLAIVVLMSGIMACEKSTHMDLMLHSLYRGRIPVLTRKIMILIGTALACTLSVHLTQYFQIQQNFELKHMEFFVQSIPCVRWLPISMTIRQFLLLLYSIRCMLTLMIGSVVMFFSTRFSRVMSIAFGVFLLLIPMGFLFLYYYG